MADTGGGNSGGGGDDNNGTELMVSIAALVISIIAFFISVAQALQQYYASATGFSNCSTDVMGPWGVFTRRLFRWSEFRFEVRFQAPVLFVAPPSNRFGPVARRRIYYLTGGDDEWLPLVTRDENYKPSWWESMQLMGGRGKRGIKKGAKKLGNEFKRGSDEPKQQRVHSTDAERASWLVLLEAVDAMEKKSIEWQESQYAAGAPSPMHTERSIALAVQARTRSWDTMPASTNKPLATTTIGHIVEIVAMLGMHWTEFDQKDNQYQATGNGYRLDGSFVDDTGVVFKMHKTGRNKWEDNRLIPSQAVKEFCFGYVPTMFRADRDPASVKPEEMKPGFKADPTPKQLNFPADADINSQRMHTLQLGSRPEISETLVRLGCNTVTREYFSRDGGEDTHLFPIIFELIGMLAQPIHIRNTSFQRLPNPSIYQWDDKGFDLLKLLTAFEQAFMDVPRDRDDDDSDNDDGEGGGGGKLPERISDISSRIQQIESLHEAEPEGRSLPLLDYLHECIDEADRWLKTRSHTDVVEIVRRHMQEVMARLNEGPLTIQTAGGGGGGGAGSNSRFLSSLNEAAPGSKEEIIADVYVNLVRPVVIGENPAGGAGATVLLTPTVPGRAKKGFQGASPSRDGAPGPGGLARPRGRTPVRRTTAGRVLQSDSKMLDLVWCVLMFRMVCWLMLHDFHRKDIQKSRSELLGSRFPVYIS